DVNAAAAALGQSLFENAAILEIYRHVYLERNVVGRVILSQNLAEKFACVERVIFDEVFPKEFAAADDLAFAHREKLKRKPLFLAVETEDVDVLLGGHRHLLRFAQGKDRVAKVAVFRSELVFSFVGKLPHTRF